MADKYLIFGATYNGDGTTSAEAASAGAAGAWNQESILTGTAPAFGSLDAGDVVKIRSKTGAGADADKTITLAASVTLGSSAGTFAAPIVWELDDGTTWSGVDGTLTITTSANTHVVTLRDGNIYRARNKHRWVLEWTHATPADVYLVMAGAQTEGVWVSLPNRATTSACRVSLSANAVRHSDLKVSYANHNNCNHLFVGASGARAVFNNLEFEIGATATTQSGIFSMSNGAALLIGGGVTGAGANTANLALAQAPTDTATGMNVRGVGFQLPKACQLLKGTTPPNRHVQIDLFGLDGGSGGALLSAWGEADSRNIDAFYPTLNATLPDSGASGVSWRVYPRNVSTRNSVATLVIAKLYTSAAAAKTVTAELLVSTDWGAGVINKATLWAEATYIDDTTGDVVALSTRDHAAGALDSSTASWSSTSWGAVGCTKHKLEVTTPTDIKQDTVVTVTVLCTVQSVTANDIFFVCPDPQLS